MPEKSKRSFSKQSRQFKEHLKAFSVMPEKPLFSALDDVILTNAQGDYAVIKVGIEAVLGPYDEGNRVVACRKN
jgi:hypothetical protein